MPDVQIEKLQKAIPIVKILDQKIKELSYKNPEKYNPIREQWDILKNKFDKKRGLLYMGKPPSQIPQNNTENIQVPLKTQPALPDVKTGLENLTINELELITPIIKQIERTAPASSERLEAMNVFDQTMRGIQENRENIASKEYAEKEFGRLHGAGILGATSGFAKGVTAGQIDLLEEYQKKMDISINDRRLPEDVRNSLQKYSTSVNQKLSKYRNDPLFRINEILSDFGAMAIPISRIHKLTGFVKLGKFAPVTSKHAASAIKLLDYAVRGSLTGIGYGAIEKIGAEDSRIKRMLGNAVLFSVFDIVLGLKIANKIAGAKDLKSAMDILYYEAPKPIQEKIIQLQEDYGALGNDFWYNPANIKKMETMLAEVEHIRNMAKSPQGKEWLKNKLSIDEKLSIEKKIYQGEIPIIEGQPTPDKYQIRPSTGAYPTDFRTPAEKKIYYDRGEIPTVEYAPIKERVKYAEETGAKIKKPGEEVGIDRGAEERLRVRDIAGDRLETKTRKEIPLKEHNQQQIELMQQAGIPKNKMTDYIGDSIADGAKLGKYADDVLTGKMTTEEAVAKIKADYQKLKAPSVKPDAEFIGFQERPGKEPTPLFNITKEGHPLKDSTVGLNTLKEQNLNIPEYEGQALKEAFRIDKAKQAANPYMRAPEKEVIAAANAGNREAQMAAWNRGINIKRETGKVEKIVTNPKGVAKITESQRRTLQDIRREISQGEAGERIPLRDSEGYIDKYSGIPSTFPDYFKNKGLSKKNVLKTIDNILTGKPVTEKQRIIVEDMQQTYRDRAARGLNEGRITGETTADKLNVGDEFKRGGEKYKVKEISEDGKVKLQNKETIYLQGDESIKYDRGTLEKPKSLITEKAVKTEKLIEPNYENLKLNQTLVDRAGDEYVIKNIKKEGVPAKWAYEIEMISTGHKRNRPLTEIERYYKIKPEVKSYEQQFIQQKAREGIDITKQQTMETKLRGREKLKAKLAEDKAKGQEDIFAKAEEKRQTDLFVKEAAPEISEETLWKKHVGQGFERLGSKKLNDAYYNALKVIDNIGIKNIYNNPAVKKLVKQKFIKDEQNAVVNSFLRNADAIKEGYNIYVKQIKQLKKDTEAIIKSGGKEKNIDLFNARRSGDYREQQLPLADKNKIILGEEKQTSFLSGQEFTKGIINAVKKDVTNRSLGFIPDPYKNVREFITKNKLKLTDAEQKKIIDYAQTLVKQGIKGDKFNKNFDDFIRNKYPEVGIAQMYERNWKAIADQNKLSPQRLYEKLKRGFGDVSGNVKNELLKQAGRAGQNAVMFKDLVAGAHSKAIRDYNEVSQIIYKDLSQDEIRILDQLIDSRRKSVIDSYKEGVKHTENWTGVQHEKYIDSIDDELRKKLTPRVHDYFKEMRNQVQQLFDNGIITQKQYEALNSYDYSPRKFLQYIDPEHTFTFGGTKKITVGSSGIDALKEGSINYLELDSQALLAEVITRTQTRIFRNRANNALLDVATQYPENGIVKVIETGRDTPGGYERFSTMVEGEKVDMIMSNNMAREWVKSDPMINQTLATWIGWLSGAKILKTMATGINPEFAITNMPRDIAHIWLTTKEYSSFAPIFLKQIAEDIAHVAKDAALKKGDYIKYIEQGGGMEFLTHQGKFNSGVNKINQLQTYLGYVGETSEILTRLALRRRAILNGKSEIEATWIARNYLDFSQGGSIIKALDTGIPYLSASVQGTRGIFRAAVKHPGRFTWQIAQLATIAGSLYMVNRSHPGYKEVSERDRVNNFIIMTSYKFRDKGGNEKYHYIKIPKDQGQRVITQVFEGLMAKVMNDKYDYDKLAMSVQEALPIIPSENLPPTLDAILGYAANKDFWRNEDIWKGPEVEKYAEYDRYTPEVLKQFGETTGLSPKRTQYALEQLFTSGNIWTSLGGYSLDLLLGQTDENTRKYVQEEVLLNKPFIRRFLDSTDPYVPYQKTNKEVRLELNTKRHISNIGLDELTEKYINKEIDKTELKRYIRANSETEADTKRMISRMQRSIKLGQEIPNKRYWLDLAEMNPEARAQVFWTRYISLDEDEKKQILKEAQTIPGIVTKEFSERLKILRTKYNRSMK